MTETQTMPSPELSAQAPALGETMPVPTQAVGSQDEIIARRAMITSMPSEYRTRQEAMSPAVIAPEITLPPVVEGRAPAETILADNRGRMRRFLGAAALRMLGRS